MKRTTLIAGALLGIAMNAPKAGSSIHVSELLGNSPGAAFAPIPVDFTRGNGPIPIFALRVRIVFDPALSSDVSAQGFNGAVCTVNQAEGYVALEVDGGGIELASTQYCAILVEGIVGGLPQFTELPLIPVDWAPGFPDGGCFDQDLELVACAMLPGSVMINHTDLVFLGRFES